MTFSFLCIFGEIIRHSGMSQTVTLTDVQDTADLLTQTRELFDNNNMMGPDRSIKQVSQASQVIPNMAYMGQNEEHSSFVRYSHSPQINVQTNTDSRQFSQDANGEFCYVNTNPNPNQNAAPVWLTNTLQGIEKKLENIEGHLESQGQRRQNVEAQ